MKIANVVKTVTTAMLSTLVLAAPGCMTQPGAAGDDPEAAAPAAAAPATPTGATSVSTAGLHLAELAPAAKPAAIDAPDAPDARAARDAPDADEAIDASAGLPAGTPRPTKPARAATAGIHPSIAWTVSLGASPSIQWPTRSSVLTAVANSDVGPTPYFIVIKNSSTGALLASCGSGTSCAATVSEAVETVDGFEAYVQDFSNPPLATSNPAFVTWQGAGLALSASQNTTGVGNSVTLTATTTIDVGPSPFYIELFDITAGTYLGACGGGTSCSAIVSQASATTHVYKALLSSFGTTLPLPNTEETTPATFVSWSPSGYTIHLANPTVNGLSETVVATTNTTVSPPYFIEVFNDFGTLLGVCGSTSVCQVTYSSEPLAMNLIGFISNLDASFPPANLQASSNTVAAPVVIP